MKLILISDTHEKHEELGALPKGDVLIHAGDYSFTGTKSAKKKFLDWFYNQSHKYKIFIAGNHDFGEPNSPIHFYEKGGPVDTYYLFESGVEIEGVKFWGAPWTPRFGQWAFMKDRKEIGEIWKKIPVGTDVLITHGPPMSILDQPFGRGEHVGDSELFEAVNRINPKIHVFGHIHGSAGQMGYYKTEFVNASVVDESYKVVNKPIIMEI